MSRLSLTRALLLIFAALLVLSMVTPAQARPRRYAEEILANWTICRNGAELEIGSANERVRLIVTSPERRRVLLDVTPRLERRPLTVWVAWDVPEEGEVVDETPETAPDEFDLANGIVSDFSRTVKVWWSPRRVGHTVTLALGAASDPSLSAATYRVGNCLLLPDKWDAGHGALKSWISRFTTLSWAFPRE